jgi:predicted  nucleic acid-binding Zn-ribbon protein
MTYQQPNPEPTGSRVGQAFGGFFRFLVRFLFVLAVGALIGAGLFYLVPWTVRSLVLPVRQNTARIAVLEQKVAQEQTRLQDENRALQDHVADLETEMATLREQSAVQNQDIEGAAGQIQQLDARITQVEGDVTAQQEDLVAQQKAVEVARSEQIDQVAGQTDELEGRLALLQTAQDLLKVRLLLLEENSRSARDTLALATAHLEQAMPLMPEQAETLTTLQERMVGLDGLIAEGSFRVLPELESLWADVMDLVLPAVAPPAGEATS